MFAGRPGQRRRASATGQSWTIITAVRITRERANRPIHRCRVTDVQRCYGRIEDASQALLRKL
jgi:hypothetical protein